MTTVELRPVREPDLDVFEAAFQSEAGASQYQWFGFTAGPGLREAFATRRLLSGADNMLSITADGALAGRVGWSGCRPPPIRPTRPSWSAWKGWGSVAKV